MDVWIVAAAAGAGYVAQHWKNILRGRHDFPSSSTQSPNVAASESSPLRQQLSEKNCPLRRVVSEKKVAKETYLDRSASSGDIHVVEVASTSGCDGENSSILDTSGSLSSRIDNRQRGQESVNDKVDGSSEDLAHLSKGEILFSYDRARRKRVLRTYQTKGQFIKPLSSLESCLMAQLYKEHAEIEDYVFSSVHSPRMPAIRPFVVSDGSKIISRGSGDCLRLPLAVEKQLEAKTFSQGHTVCGVPQLPKVKHIDLQRKAKLTSGRDQVGKSSNSSRRANMMKHQRLQGASDGAFIFCLGISVGIISAFLGNRREVNKLNELLKQTENLVQDLQEELEMKDSLTVKELPGEDCESQDTRDDSFFEKPLQLCSPGHQLESTEHDHGKFHDENVEENSRSKIEAELEAELERLELSMNASGLEGKLTDLVELDPDFVPDVAVGELRADYFGRQADSEHYADEDGTGTSTTHSANYAVSPRALSLRLHEVVQSRLEERVKELETALQNSQRKVTSMEYEHLRSWRNLSSSDGGSSAQRSPVDKGEQQCTDHPVVINLTGDALDAYNEAYDLLTRVNDSEEDKPTRINNNGISLQPCDQSPHQVQNRGTNSRSQSNTSLNGQPSAASDYREERGDNNLLYETGASGDESDHSHDEMEELLIKHIVEKARKRSSVVLNVQRALFSDDEN